MSFGWSCPNCGKAHAPSVKTCPEPAKDKAVNPLPGYPLDPYYPPNTQTWVPSKCPTCGLVLDTVMGYVCNNVNCPTGLGGVKVMLNESGTIKS